MNAYLRMQLRRSLVQTFVVTVAVSAFNLLTGVVLARALGPEDRGHLAAAILWPTLLQFVVMVGAIEAINYRAARPDTDVSKLAGTVGGLALVQITVMAIAGAVLLPLILGSYGDETVLASFLYLGALAITIFGVYMVSIISGAGRFGVYNVLRLVLTGPRVVAILVLAVTVGLTVTDAVAAYFAGIVPTAIAATVIVRRMAGRKFARPDRELAKSLASYGWRSQLSSVRNPLNEQLDQFLVSVFLAPRLLGLYTVAFTTTYAIGFVSATVAVVALPRVAAAETVEHSRLLARRYLGVSVLASALVAAPLAAFAGPIVESVFGEGFAGATEAARILLISAVLVSLTRVGSSILNGLHRPGDAGVAGLLSLGGTAAGVALLLGPFGIEGAAAGTLVGYGMSSVWCMSRLGRALSIQPLRLLVPARRANQTS